MVEEGKLTAIISTIVLAELSVGYYRSGKIREKESFFVRLTSIPSYKIVPVDAAIADHAGRIRAETGLSLPDAILVATALESGARTLLTDDSEFRKVKHLLRVLSPMDYK